MRSDEDRVIRAAIFDWGGVIVQGDLQRAPQEWDKQLGRPSGTVLRAMFAGTDQTVLIGRIAADAHWQTVSDALELDPRQHDELRRHLTRSETFDQELASFVRGLRPRLKTAFLTNQWSDGRELMARHRAEELVDTVVISAEVGVAKPDPAIFEIALRRLEVVPHEAVFVDDSPENVEAAAALGLHSILHTSRRQTIEAIKSLTT